MPYESINPYNQQLLKTYSNLENGELNEKLNFAYNAYLSWSQLLPGERVKIVQAAGHLLGKDIQHHARLISLEMGKPIRESVAEIEKCILVCDYYCQNAAKILKQKDYSDKNHESYVWFEPTGIVFAVMPWNFPYWQVFRFLMPNLVLGNAALLKHASNVPQCADAIEKLFLKAGMPAGVFQNLFINYEQAEEVIRFHGVSGVTVTGSEYAGSVVAGLAGRLIKKSVLELGGSDPFIVLEDADIETAVHTGIMARMRNAGQSCIASKRFILHKKIREKFVEQFIRRSSELVLGDPLSEQTEMGPLAREYLLEEVEKQVADSVALGAEIHLGGKRSSTGKLFYQPTVISGIHKSMPLYSQEIFGPVAMVFNFETLEEAVFLANDTEFGLGASIWTQNRKKALEIAKKVKSGIIAINGLVTSEPHIPFGGVKKSGYGRELSEMGLTEFANIKTINIF